MRDEEILQLLVPILTSWQAEAQQAAAEAFANLAYKNPLIRKEMSKTDASKVRPASPYPVPSAHLR